LTNYKFAHMELKEIEEKEEKAYITCFKYKLAYNISSLERDTNWVYM
jgi:hypothetical protein